MFWLNALTAFLCVSSLNHQNDKQVHKETTTQKETEQAVFFKMKIVISKNIFANISVFHFSEAVKKIWNLNSVTEMKPGNVKLIFIMMIIIIPGFLLFKKGHPYSKRAREPYFLWEQVEDRCLSWTLLPSSASEGNYIIAPNRKLLGTVVYP